MQPAIHWARRRLVRRRYKTASRTEYWMDPCGGTAYCVGSNQTLLFPLIELLFPPAVPSSRIADHIITAIHAIQVSLHRRFISLQRPLGPYSTRKEIVCQSDCECFLQISSTARQGIPARLSHSKLRLKKKKSLSALHCSCGGKERSRDTSHLMQSALALSLATSDSYDLESNQ